jgi:hypothetical protein
MAAEVILILQEFFPTQERAGDPRQEPGFPALERVLAAAQHEPLGSDWRAALAQRHGSVQGAAALSSARIAARVFAGGDTAALAPGCWLATPVHYFAGLDSVHLHPAGLLRLSPEEQAALVGDFNREFADGAWRLWATGRRELLLSGVHSDAGGADPARWLGKPLERGPVGRAGASELRRLGVGLEMWLHEHPLNRAREAGGKLRVIGLWLWGSEPLRLSTEARRGSPVTLWGQDTVAEAIGQLSGWSHEAATPDGPGALRGDGIHVVLLPGTAGEGGVLDPLERCWLTPALAALRAGTLQTLELFAGAHAFRLRRLHLARFWRSRAPWREALA